jgi:hypothetical protein
MAETRPVTTSSGYHLALVDTAGRTKLSLERQVVSWTTRKTDPTFTPLQDTTATPYPGIRHIREDARGHVLVLLRRPRSDWKAVKQEDRYAAANSHTVLEVLDPVRGRLLATAQVEGFPLRLLSDTRFATYREDSDGVPWVDVWEITFAMSST